MLGLVEAMPITSVYQLGLALGYALIVPTAFAWWQRMPARSGAAAGLACLVAGVGIMTVAKTGQVPVLGVVGVVVWALAPGGAHRPETGGSLMRKLVCNQRGSALLAAIALSAVMMILGLALFDLGRIENALVLSNKTDTQAFEIAQAGIERAMDRLLRTFVVEQAANPTALTDLSPSWADGHTQGGSTVPLCTGGCATTEFRAADAAYLSNMAFDGGTYALSFKLLTATEAAANPYGQACAANAAGTCKDLLLVRSSGTRAGVPPGYTGQRVIQILVKVSAGALGLDGLVTGSQTRSMNGNVNIAGSIAVIEAPAGAPAWELRGTANQANHWAGLNGVSPDGNLLLDRLRPRPLICPPGRTCASSADHRESLGANLFVRMPLDVPAVKFRGGGDAGTSSDSGVYGTTTNTFDPQRRGLGPLSAVGVADGCVMPCNQTVAPVGSFENPGNISTLDGNITNPYPSNGPTRFPMLTDKATVNNVLYDQYACPAGFSCSGSEFFVTNALNLGTTNLTFTSGTAFSCTAAVPCATPNQINGVKFINPATGTPVNSGSVCWTPAAGTPALGLLEFKTGANCTGNPTSTLNPLLIYTTGTFKISGNIRYSGAAIFLTQPGSATAPSAPTGVGVYLVDSIITACVDLGNGDPCGRKFLVDPLSPVCPSGIPNGTPNCATDMLSVLTTSPTTNGNMTFEGHNGDAVMGVFYAGVPSPSSGGGVLRIEHQIKMVGSAAGSQLDFRNVPDFYQVPGATIAVMNFNGSPFSIAMVPGFWRICSPGSSGNPTTAINPTTPTGVCGYN